MATENRKGKHLTLADRMTIEHGLSLNWTLAGIAKKLDKDPTTLSKEIKKNRKHQASRGKLPCGRKGRCSVRNLCRPFCGDICSACRLVNCTRCCNDYSPAHCAKITKYPFVCNGCASAPNCPYERFRYSAKVAEANYRETLTSSRQGIDITAFELRHLDELISPLVKKGQSIFHIYTNNEDKIGCSQRTLYNHFDRGLFSATNLDLPRKVRLKKRKKSKGSVPSTQRYSFGRTYEDFPRFLEQSPDVPVVEMDTFKGRREKGKVLLTLFFRNSSLMLAFLLDSCSQECVRRMWNLLYLQLGHEAFTALFPVILTDNGSEFKAPLDIELSPEGARRTKVFYCHPMNSNQRARSERNHEYFRYIFPKGTSLDSFSQEDITRAVNHINSTARASLDGATPFQLALEKLDRSLFDILNLKQVSANNVHLKPRLIKK